MQLQDYRRLLIDELETYGQQLLTSTGAVYGPHSTKAVELLLAEIANESEHWCGVLALAGYELQSGANQRMILQAARALELEHASIRLFDSASTSETAEQRRVALSAAQTGHYTAHMALANLDGASEENRLKAISVLNRSGLLRSHGTLNKYAKPPIHDEAQLRIWRVAHYQFLNPLHVGMILAGADCHATDAITEFALNLGQTYASKSEAAGYAHRARAALESEASRWPAEPVNMLLGVTELYLKP